VFTFGSLFWVHIRHSAPTSVRMYAKAAAARPPRTPNIEPWIWTPNRTWTRT